MKILILILSLCFLTPAFAAITIDSYSTSGDPTISADPSYYDVYIVELIVDGIVSQASIPPHEAETLGVWDQTKVQTYLDTRYDNVKEMALQTHEYKLTHPELDKIEHPHFTIEWNEASGVVINASSVSVGTQTAEDFIMQSPSLAPNVGEAWNNFDDAIKADRKSIGTCIMSLYKLVEDLRSRVDTLEKGLSP